MLALRGGIGREDAVLIVDDDSATADSLAAVLSDSGFGVHVVPDAAEASAALQQARLAVVIVDQELAGNTGERVALELKHQDPSASVVLLTSAIWLERVLDAAEHLDGLLVKPLVPQAFVQTIRNVLSTRVVREENRLLRADVERLGGGQEPDVIAGVDVDADRFRAQLARLLFASQSSGNPLALVLVELGGWTTLKEAGQEAAEEAMVAASGRLSSSRRRGDLVSRVAENRFAVVCCDVGSPAACRRVVKIVHDELDAPFTVNGIDHWFAPTAGAVVSDLGSPDQSADVLLEEAQVALDYAFDQGRSWRIFEKSMRDDVLSRANVAVKVREAMSNQELSLAYRPVIELRGGRVVGATAHLRWQTHSTEDLLSSDFLADEGDPALSAQVNAWILDRAFADLARWRDEQRLPEGFTLALDVSSREVGDPQFTEELEELLVKHGIDASMIGIDLPEPAARQATAANGAFARLSALGVSFSLDDLGAGWTQLSWLRDLPVEALKIDSSLVDALDRPDDARGIALVRGLIALGRELHLIMVAKGVRTAAQRAALLAMGCDLAERVELGRPGPLAYDWEIEPEPVAAKPDSRFSASRGEHEIVNPEDDPGRGRT